MSEQLKPYRNQIDKLDVQILELLAQRFEVVRDVGHLKSEQDITIIQSQRAQEVVDHVVKIAEEKNIPTDLVKNFYLNMIEEAHKIEFAIKDKTQKTTKTA